MTETITHFFLFFALAFLSGLFWPAFHAMIGAPESVPDESAGLGAQFVKTLKISKPGMIFRRYGEWLCRKQNEWEKKYDKSLLYFATILCHFPEKIIYSVETSYGRDGNSIQDFKIERSENKVTFLVKLFPGEESKFSCIDNGVPITGYFFPEFPGFNRSKIPLSPYKALGLCPNCTVFWIMLFTLIAACFMGLFPPSYFYYVGPIIPAYGLAMWGTQIYE